VSTHGDAAGSRSYHTMTRVEPPKIDFDPSKINTSPLLPSASLEFVEAWAKAHVAVETQLDTAVAVVTQRPPKLVYPLDGTDGGEQWAPVCVDDRPIPALSSRLASVFFTKPHQEAMARAADRYYDCVAKALLLEYSVLKKMEKRADLWQFTKGALPEKMAKELDGCRGSYDRVLAAVTSLADLLDRDLPDFPDVVLDDEDGSSKSKGGVLSMVSTEFGPFEDAITRSFYRDIPNLRETLPAILFDPETCAPALVVESPAANTPSFSRASVARDDTKHIKGTLDGALGQLSDSRKPKTSVAPPPVPITVPKPVSAPVSVPKEVSPPHAMGTGLSRLLAVRQNSDGVTIADEEDDGDDKKYKPSARLRSLLSSVGEPDVLLEEDTVADLAAHAKSAAAVKFSDLLQRLSGYVMPYIYVCVSVSYGAPHMCVYVQ
jgi:hypothetical protein